MSATVLIGPRTRLGRAVLDQLRGQPVLAVARDAAHAAQVAQLPGISPDDVVDATGGQLSTRVAALGDGPVRLVVAALGPVHPETPRTSYDAAAVVRDLDLVEQVLSAGRPVQVVLVSTVLALAPGEDRRYYGGWKAVVEQQLQELVDVRRAAGGEATLAVLYPGRLLEASQRRGRRRLHTSYTRLAGIALSSAAGSATGRPVGLDSRFWLLVSSISLALRSLTPSTRRSVSPSPRPGEQDQHPRESG